MNLYLHPWIVMTGLCFMAACGLLSYSGTASAQGLSPNTYCTVNGNVVIEAEDFTRTGGTIGAPWTLQTAEPGYSGAGYMQASIGDPPTLQFSAVNAHLAYEINFRETGTWYVHLRSWAADHTQNGFFASVDGKQVIYDHPKASYIYTKKLKRWSWYTDSGGAGVRDSMVFFHVTEPGVHTLTLYRRDKGGSRLDRIWLSMHQQLPLDSNPEKLPDPAYFRLPTK